MTDQNDTAKKVGAPVINLSEIKPSLILLHSERPKLYTVLAFLNAVGLKQI